MELRTEVGGREHLKLRYLFPLAVVTLVAPAMVLAEAGTVAWRWFSVGALVTALFLGLLPRTSVGQAIDGSSRRVGFLGRVLVILTLAALVWTTGRYLQPDTVAVGSFIVGSVVAVLVVTLVERYIVQIFQ